ncbi:MAG: cadherin repeat domain-containing protein [Candidatus Dojkabacteria bacterium]
MMKKFLALFITTILLAPIFSLGLKAEVLGDPNDILTVATPSPNQKIGGTVNVTWYMYDNNQNVIPYKLNLYDASTCRTTNFGQINSTNTGISSTTQLNSYSWNTRSTLSTANLVDGNYCLKICLAMKNGSGDYSACNARFVKIVNNNRAPIINSIPTNLIIKESEAWSYQIRATDPDGDTIIYRMVAGVPFLTINQQTGLISTNGVSKALPAGVNRADYNIIVSADDNFAGSVNQQFTITIIKDTSVGVPPPVTTPVSTPTGVTPNKPSVINFTSPKEGQEFTGMENKISWEASDVDGINSLKLSYSKDANTWLDITKFTGTIPSEFNWDVGGIEDGSYFLQIIVKDNIGNEVSRISKKFAVNNNSAGPDQTNNPLIINLKPQNNSQISELRPEIAGDFIPADNAEIKADTFTIQLNGQDGLLDCQHDNKSFSCRPKDDLKEGLNKITATIKDSSDREVKVEWSFSVSTLGAVSSPVGTTNEETVIILGREIPRNIFNIILIVCCIAGLLILIPWVLYLLWTGRKKKEETTVETKTTYDFDEPVVTQKEVETTSTITPTDTSGYYTPENYSYPGYSYVPEPIKTETTTTETITTPAPDSKPVEIPTPVVTSLAKETKPIAVPEVRVEETKPVIVPEVKVENTITPVETKVEEVKTDTPLVTNNTNIDDYYSYVNPSGDIPVTPAIDTTTKTPESTDDYVEPKETT